MHSLNGPIVYVVATPSPFRNAEVDRAAKAVGPDAFRVMFMQPSRGDGCWEDRFPKVCPFHTVSGTPEQNGISIEEATTRLASMKPRLVICGGYNDLVARRVLKWCRATRMPFCFRSDSNIWTDRSQHLPRRTVRYLRLRYWVAKCHSCLVTGEFNREYWRRFGMRADQEGWWPQWIDYDRFSAARALRSAERDALRKEFGIRTKYSLLYVGRLIPLKRIDLLCEAMMRSKRDVSLVLAGAGDQEAMIREKYGKLLGDRLRMLGPVDPRDLPRVYAAADAFVIASGAIEQWGMVLNEATTAGLPVICDRHVGAAGELLKDGVNGIALTSNDVESWVAAIDQLTSDAAGLEQMGIASARIADEWQQRSEPGNCIRALLDEEPVYRG